MRTANDAWQTGAKSKLRVGAMECRWSWSCLKSGCGSLEAKLMFAVDFGCVAGYQDASRMLESCHTT